MQMGIPQLKIQVNSRLFCEVKLFLEMLVIV